MPCKHVILTVLLVFATNNYTTNTQVRHVNTLATESSKALIRFADTSELCQYASSDSYCDD